MSRRHGIADTPRRDGGLPELQGGHFDEDDFVLDELLEAEDEPEDLVDPGEDDDAPATTAAPVTSTTRTPAAALRPVGRRRPLVPTPSESPDGLAAAGASPYVPATLPARSNPLVPLLVVALVVMVIWAVYQNGRPATPAPPASAASTTATFQLDQAKVDAFTARVQADPTDVTALRGLTDQYYASGDYAKAAQWQAKVVAAQPKDVSSRLVYAAALANAGDAARAEQEWLAVLKLDPRQAEAYYNLGVLHFSAEPPDVERARTEWRKVVELEPESDLAKNVVNHLDRMGAAANSAPAAGPTSAPASGANSAPSRGPASSTK